MISKKVEILLPILQHLIGVFALLVFSFSPGRRLPFTLENSEWGRGAWVRFSHGRRGKTGGVKCGNVPEPPKFFITSIGLAFGVLITPM